MRRNRSKIDLCGPKSVQDHGDGITYFRDLGFSRFFYTQYIIVIYVFKKLKKEFRIVNQIILLKLKVKT